MAKEIKAQLKMRVPAGAATPAPPVGVALGQHGLNIMDFCKKFNALTASRKGEVVSVKLTVYKDKTYDFTVKTPPATDLLKKRASIQKGASNPSKEKAGSIRMSDIEEIAKLKMEDLNAFSLESAKKIIMGSARSMGLEVVD